MPNKLVLLNLIACGLFAGGFSCGIVQAQSTDATRTNNLEEIISTLMDADEFKAAEQRQFGELPITAIPILTARLNAVPKGVSDARLFESLASKFLQFEGDLREPELSRAVDALAARSLASTKSERQLKLQSLKGISNLRVRAIVAKLQESMVRSDAPIDSGVTAPSDLTSADDLPRASSPSGPPTVLPAISGKKDASSSQRKTPLWIWALLVVVVIIAIKGLYGKGLT